MSDVRGVFLSFIRLVIEWICLMVGGYLGGGSRVEKVPYNSKIVIRSRNPTKEMIFFRFFFEVLKLPITLGFLGWGWLEVSVKL